MRKRLRKKKTIKLNSDRWKAMFDPGQEDKWRREVAGRYHQNVMRAENHLPAAVVADALIAAKEE